MRPSSFGAAAVNQKLLGMSLEGSVG